MATTYLSRTPASTTNQQIFTFSTWFKFSDVSATYNNIASFGASSVTDGVCYIDINSSKQLEIFMRASGTEYKSITTQLFRDTNAFYHIVVAVDTTQATSTNRTKVYVNGSQVSAFSTQNAVPQSTNLLVNTSGSENRIGASRDSGGTIGNYLNGSLAHTHFIDGTQYQASDFGETDATTGIWKPKTAPSVTYGTNGFFLKFENSGAFGTDSSGNGNNFTVNGTMTQTIDTPSNVFATWNPLMKPSSASTFSNGNLTVTNGTNSVYPYSVSNQGFSQGKWYAEFKYTPSGNAGQIGIMDLEIATTNFQANNVGSSSNGCITYQYNGNIIGNGTVHSTGHTSLSSGDIVGVAVDEDNQLIYFYVNGTLQNSGGTDYSGDAFTSGFVGFYCGDASGGGTDTWEANFGNGYFGTTAVSSAQNPDDGIGIFEYDVPTGYRALCTKSINAQEYS
jgi:hypothetical protein